MKIVYIVEAGLLEQQAVLLQKSIQRFSCAGHEITGVACCVRDKHQPEQQTIDIIRQLGGEYLCENLNNKHHYFPLCNGIYAANHVQQNTRESVLLVDTDTVFINPLNVKLFEQHRVSVRPVDNKGIGSCGSGDPADEFWQNCYQLFGLVPPEETVETTVDQVLIRPYYNSGFIYAQYDAGFFQQWQETFEQLMDSEIRSRSTASRHQVGHGFHEQMSISIVLDQLQIKPWIPAEVVNYPLPFRPRLKKRSAPQPTVDELVHLHYHRWFQHPGFIGHVFDEQERKSKTIQWLSAQLPLQPEISGPQKC